MRIQYEITRTTKETKTVSIQDLDFIVVSSWRNGIEFYTAFIGSGEANRDKIMIEVSKSGGFFNIEKIYGSALLNAIYLLVKEARNHIVPNSIFINTVSINFHFIEQVTKLINSK